MNNPEQPTEESTADDHDKIKEATDQGPIEEVATSKPPDREPGVPDMQVIKGTPWLGLV